MPNKIKGILFDLDGTLLDTAKDLIHALNLSMEKHGFPACDEQIAKEQVSFGSLAMTRSAIPNESEQIQAMVREDMLCFYHQVNGSKTCLFDGIAELLSYLTEKKYALGIITNKPARFARPLVSRFSEFANFHAVVSGDSTSYSKPNTQPMYLTASQLSLQPNEIIYVGDAITDIIAAKNVNMHSAIASWGYIAKTEELQSWNADQLLDRPSDLIRLFNL